ncbi:MAG: hypothetical protein ABII82_15835 [Verrucomicrobiota bacterium]
MKTRSLITLLAVALGFFFADSAPQLRAQIPQSTAPTTINLRFMSWERASSGLFLKTDSRNYTAIQAPSYGWGTSYQITNAAALKLYQQVERDGVKTYEIAAEAPLPANCIDFQVAVIRQSGEMPYRLIVLPNDSNLFSSGDVRVFNFSAYPAMVKLGGETIPLSPLEWRKVSVKPDRKYRVALLTAIQIAGAWLPGTQEILILRPDYRGDVMILHTKGLPGGLESTDPENAARPLTIAETEYLADARRRERNL